MARESLQETSFMTDTPPAVTARPLLLVDDDATFLRVLARAMASRGFEVITAAC
jgi:two-component system response regulator RegA